MVYVVQGFGQDHTLPCRDGHSKELILGGSVTVFVRVPRLASLDTHDDVLSVSYEDRDLGPDKAFNRNDAARRARPSEPRSMFELLSVYAGHSSSSG